MIFHSGLTIPINTVKILPVKSTRALSVLYYAMHILYDTLKTSVYMHPQHTMINTSFIRHSLKEREQLLTAKILSISKPLLLRVTKSNVY